MLIRSRGRLQAVRIVVVGVGLSIGTMHPVHAQSLARRSTNRLQPIHALDTWLVSHYQRAQLLPDSLIGHEVIGEELSPRVESVADAPAGDTLFAVQFRTRRELSLLRTGAPIRLTGPSGSITTITADVIARRPFRAPRRPGADTASAGGWRYGWAYAAVVRRRFAATPASVYRGWLLLEARDSTVKR